MVLAHAILVALRDGPKHGYAIRRALEERIGLLSPVNQGQVYATLARLARAGEAREARAARADTPRRNRYRELRDLARDLLDVEPAARDRFAERVVICSYRGSHINIRHRNTWCRYLPSHRSRRRPPQARSPSWASASSW